MEDAVLRMLMDKYRPLRSTTDGRAAESARLAQTPRPVERPISARVDPVPSAPAKPHTPPGQPWNAVYVRPSHACAQSPQVYRGKYLNVEPPKSAAAQKLAELGVSAASLPRDDRKAMGELRDTLRRAVHQERLERARDVKLQRAGRAPQAEAEEPSRPTIAVVGAVKGLAGLAEQKIEDARRRGVFQQNSLRGKPLVADEHSGNPHLQREEFLLNRMVQRQGGMPPWVALNHEMMTEDRALRQRVQHAWVCRALLQLGDADWRSMAPVAVHWHAEADAKTGAPLYTIEAQSPEEARTLAWVQGFRDPAWLRRESAYHEAAIKNLNEVIRRYNHVAPFSARKMLHSQQTFLQSTLQGAFPFTVAAVSARLRGLQQVPPAPPAPTRWFSWFKLHDHALA